MAMPTYKGPCEECGNPIEKYIRPGRKALCLSCGIARSVAQQREMADPTSDLYRQNCERGQLYSKQFRQRKGQWYDRWRGGMAAYLNTSFPTKDPDAATVANEPTATRRKPTRRQQADGRYQR